MLFRRIWPERECLKMVQTIFLKAAEAGFPQAQYYTGNCYMDGTGLTKKLSFFPSVLYAKKPLVKGVSNAQWVLAQCYRRGDGTPVNYDQSMYWYAEAAPKVIQRLLNTCPS